MKPRIAVHKFASCDGCQLAFLNAGEDLLTLTELVELVHFAEAGPVAPEAEVDIAFVEGSVSTPEDLERIQTIRARSRLLVTMGACATAGGLQALRNSTDGDAWIAEVYATPAYVSSLATATPIRSHVKVDLELWGCPVSSRQVLAAVRALLFGVAPVSEHDKVCVECKRQGVVCVMVAQDKPCLGPVTRTGCGAICPRFGRDCYACFGPAENANSEALGARLEGLGLSAAAIRRRFRFINVEVTEFQAAAARHERQDDERT